MQYRDYLNYEIPEKWIVEEDDDTISIYCEQGEGALTLSFYTMQHTQRTLPEEVTIMAKKFFDSNQIKLNGSFMVKYNPINPSEKVVLHGDGLFFDESFLKLWIVAKFPKAIVATYNSEKKTAEIEQVERIVSSFTFI